MRDIVSSWIGQIVDMAHDEAYSLDVPPRSTEFEEILSRLLKLYSTERFSGNPWLQKKASKAVLKEYEQDIADVVGDMLGAINPDILKMGTMYLTKQR